MNKKMKGCGNHGCIIEEPKGMGTNSICKCASNIAYEVQDISGGLSHFTLRKVVEKVIKILKESEDV